jgi:hypothetical protein
MGTEFLDAELTHCIRAWLSTEGRKTNGVYLSCQIKASEFPKSGWSMEKCLIFPAAIRNQLPAMVNPAITAKDK